MGNTMAKFVDNSKVIGDNQYTNKGDIWDENVDKCQISVDNSD